MPITEWMSTPALLIIIIVLAYCFVEHHQTWEYVRKGQVEIKKAMALDNWSYVFSKLLFTMLVVASLFCIYKYRFEAAVILSLFAALFYYHLAIVRPSNGR